MASASWQFILVRSYDMLPLGELTQARDRQISLGLNKSGSLSFNVPANDPLGSTIYPIEHGVMAYRIGSTGAKLVWSGFVNTIDEDWSGNRLTVNCVGWLDRLAKHPLHADKVWSNIDDSLIIAELLGHASGAGANFATVGYTLSAGVNSFSYADGISVQWPMGSSPNLATWIKWGGTLPNEGSGGATAYTTALRSGNYPKYQTNVLQAIQQLTEIENGCDIYVDPQTRALYVYRKRRRILPGVVFGFQWGPENIAQLSRQLDGSTVDNMHIVTGAVGTTPAYQSDTGSQALYGPLEEQTSLSDVYDSGVLQAYASAEVTVRAVPRQLISFTPFNWTDENSVPEPFVEYDIGDQVAFRAIAQPRLSLNQQVRIFGMSFGIDNEDNEKIGALQVSP